jgi:hypothetical protein
MVMLVPPAKVPLPGETPVTVGGSGMTLMLAVFFAVLNAVVPPFVVVSTLLP